MLRFDPTGGRPIDRAGWAAVSWMVAVGSLYALMLLRERPGIGAAAERFLAAILAHGS